MEKTKPSYNRLIFIDREIRNGKYPNCSTLAKDYEVTARTIQRDIEYMKDMMDAPIAYDSKRRGYYYTEENFHLPAVNIKESDFFAICIAEKALEQYRETPLYGRLVGVFDKIRDLLPETIRVNTSWIDTSLSFKPESAAHMDPAIWESVASALRLKREIAICHQSPGGEPTTRSVRPYHLVNYRGEWYLVAHCLLKNEVRTFAVSRITRADMSARSFQEPADFDFDAYLGSQFGIMRDAREYTVKIRFSPAIAPYVTERTWQRDQEIREERDGSVLLSFRARSFIDVKRWVFSWGSGATVIAPKELADAMKEELEEMRRAYGE